MILLEENKGIFYKYLKEKLNKTDLKLFINYKNFYLQRISALNYNN